MKYKLLFIFFLWWNVTYALQLDSVSLQPYSKAVCNSGQPANYYLKKAKSKKWFIALQGNGVCTDKESCEKRFKEKRKYVTSWYFEQRIKKANLVGLFDNPILQNYNIAFLPYCSSDLYVGNHEHRLKYRNMQFRGRAIVLGMFQDLTEKQALASATEVVIAGWSAGAIGVAANLDLWESLSAKKRYLFSSYWITHGEREFLIKNQLPPASVIRFIFNNPPPNCRQHYLNCYPSNYLLRTNPLDAMILFNLGDTFHQSPDLEKIKKRIKGRF